MKKNKSDLKSSRYKTLLKSEVRYNRNVPTDNSIFFFTMEGYEKHLKILEKLKKSIYDRLNKKKKIEEETPAVPDNVVRYEPDIKVGLTKSQVDERIANNLINKTKVKSTKSYWSIFAKNIFTFFNMLWLIIAVALIAVGSYSDLIFIFVIVANTAIAIIQEIRAKITIEKLSIVTAPLVKTIRDGEEIMIASDQLLLDDIIVLKNGNQIPSDCKIIDGKVEANESLLTGESNAIEKTSGDWLLSGSFIVSGQCYAKVEKIGKDNYVYQMAKKAKEFKAPESNLFKDLNRLIKYIGIALVPIGILTFLKQYTAGASLKDQITYTSGALTSMIPAGMFLLVTVALAIGVIKLARKKTLVRDLYSIEMLARTNVLCLDKTGTITDGTMKVVDYMTFTNRRKASITKILTNILNLQKTINSTSSAMIKEFGRHQDYTALNTLEFSSERKYSITQFSNKKIYFLGAYTRIGCKLTPEQLEFVKQQQSKGKRIIALAE